MTIYDKYTELINDAEKLKYRIPKYSNHAKEIRDNMDITISRLKKTRYLLSPSVAYSEYTVPVKINIESEEGYQNA